MRNKSLAARRRVIYFSMTQFDKWFVYIVECADGTYYTGVTKNLERRVREHNVSKKGAKYTKSRRPVRLVAHIVVNSVSDALKLESKVKKQKRQNKIAFLIKESKNAE